METRQRTVVKAVLWSVLGFLVMVLVGIGFTGSVSTGGAMAAINAATGLITYVIYERVWARVRWGRA